jgi:hypothetical protein
MNYHNYTNIPTTKYGSNYGTWRPDTLENNNILVHENINTNWKYRRYIQNNADILIPLNNEIDLEDKINNTSFVKQKVINNPILYTNCIGIAPINTPHLSYSDLKSNYLKKYEEDCRNFCPQLRI